MDVLAFVISGHNPSKTDLNALMAGHRLVSSSVQ